MLWSSNRINFKDHLQNATKSHSISFYSIDQAKNFCQIFQKKLPNLLLSSSNFFLIKFHNHIWSIYNYSFVFLKALISYSKHWILNHILHKVCCYFQELQCFVIRQSNQFFCTVPRRNMSFIVLLFYLY